MSKQTRILAFDISLTCPGAAVIEIKNGKPRLETVSHVKTSANDTHALRADIVESWATLFIVQHIGNRSFDYVVREDFHGRSSTQNYPVFAAWSGVERAVHKFGLTIDKYVTHTKAGRKKTQLGMSQSRIKNVVTGKGNADKPEVEQAVRDLTGYAGEFATDDESDAAAVGLGWAIEHGLIKREE